jgi:hypothetical protein
MIAGKRRDTEGEAPVGSERRAGREGIVPGRKAAPKVPPRKLKAGFHALSTPAETAESTDTAPTDPGTQSPS